MHKIMVAGIGTEVGKTVVSAILAKILQGDYWKPIQCGLESESDTEKMRTWLEPTHHTIYPPIYSLQAPLSPHQAAYLEGVAIHPHSITLPTTTKPLIIEGVGGLLVPITHQALTIDLFIAWECQWIIVSRHYLGSINHSLLTLEALQKRKINILGWIFNGPPQPHSESIILEISQLPCLGRLLPECTLNPITFQRYQQQWYNNIHNALA